MTPLTQPLWRYVEIVVFEDGSFGLRRFDDQSPQALRIVKDGLTFDEAMAIGQRYEDSKNPKL